MEIEDFIPDYPDRSDPTFNKKILDMKEFNELQTGQSSVHYNNEILYSHQVLISRFMSPYTTYDSILLYHTPGTGKTCAAVAVAESALKGGAYGIKSVLIIVPTDTLRRQWKESIAGVCTGGKYMPPAEENDEERSALSTSIQITKRVGQFYTIITHGEHANLISKLDDQAIVNKYSNTLIIVDEAHNLRIQPGVTTETGKKKSIEQYSSFLRFFSLVRNCKKILLTGTPMVDDAEEIAGLFNMILPVKDWLPTGSEFKKKYISSKATALTELKNKLVGRVSFIREGGHAPTRIDNGVRKFTKYIPAFLLKASATQRDGYNEALNHEIVMKRSTLHSDKRQAINFVYKIDNEYVWGDISRICTFIKVKVRSAPIENGGARSAKDSYMMTKITDKYVPGTIENIRKNLKDYSVVYDFVKNFILEHPAEPTFIFNPLVSGAGGVEFMAAILELFSTEFTRVVNPRNLKKSTDSKKRFAVITGNTPYREDILKTFNSEQNRDGSLIHTLIGSIAISEGINLVNVRNVLIRPYWNNSVIEQAIARGIRADSLKWMPAKDRKVNVYRLLVWFNDPELDVGDSGKNIDIHMYSMSEEKDKQIKVIERVLKEVAFDCPMNYQRNVKPEFAENSRDCDYTICKYKCYQVDNGNGNDAVVGTGTGTGTGNGGSYYINYSNHKIDKIKENIKRFMQKHGLGYIDKLIHTTSDVKDKKLVIEAITQMINSNDTALNKYGQRCFLRYRFGTLYLTPSLSFHNDYYFLNYYARQSNIVTSTNLNVIAKDIIMDSDITKYLRILPRYINDKVEFNKRLKVLAPDTKIFIVEALMNMMSSSSDSSDPKIVSKLNKTLLYKYFKDFIFEMNPTEDNPGKTLFHTMNRMTACGISKEYTDFEIDNGKGQYRCLNKNGEFFNCENKPLAKAIVDKAMDKQISEKLQNAPGETMYGVTTNCTFNIVDTTSAVSSKTGKNCDTWMISDLKELIARKIKKYTTADKVNAEVKKLENESVGSLCKTIKEYLTDENDLVVEWKG